MKVKIFSGYVADVERMMNEWMTSNIYIQITSISQSTTGSGPVLTVVVLYEDNDRSK